MPWVNTKVDTYHKVRARTSGCVVTFRHDSIKSQSLMVHYFLTRLSTFGSKARVSR